MLLKYESMFAINKCMDEYFRDGIDILPKYTANSILLMIRLIWNNIGIYFRKFGVSILSY